MFSVKILTTIPEAFPGILAMGLSGKASVNGLWSYDIIDIKQWGIGRYRKVDDRPFGGGAGMVMMAGVLAEALEEARRGLTNPRIIYTSARGKKFTQSTAREIINDNRPLIILCGRFEGVDQRVINLYDIEEFCIGDFILSGGEIAAMVIADTCVRLIPGAVGNDESILHDSFTLSHEGMNLVEYPQYTRPRVWRGMAVPDILCSGDHARIESWRLKQALKTTSSVRPDLLDKTSTEGSNDIKVNGK